MTTKASKISAEWWAKELYNKRYESLDDEQALKVQDAVLSEAEFFKEDDDAKT